jgi:hypothetical protein
MRTVPRLYSKSHREELVTRGSVRGYDSWGHGLGAKGHYLDPLPGNDWRRHRRLGRFNVCYNDLQTSWISESAIITFIWEFEDFSKSNYQSKPRVCHWNRDSIYCEYHTHFMTHTADTKECILVSSGIETDDFLKLQANFLNQSGSPKLGMGLPQPPGWLVGRSVANVTERCYMTRPIVKRLLVG